MARALAGVAIGAAGFVGISSLRHLGLGAADCFQTLLMISGGVLAMGGGLLMTIGGALSAVPKCLDAAVVDYLRKARDATEIFHVLEKAQKELGKVEKQA